MMSAPRFRVHMLYLVVWIDVSHVVYHYGWNDIAYQRLSLLLMCLSCLILCWCVGIY
jgi:hypothetical protein